MSLADLTQYDEDFRNAESVMSSYVPNEGSHRVIIEDVEFVESKFGGWQVVLVLRNLDEPGVWRKYYKLEPPEFIKYLKRDLKIMGMDVENVVVSQLPKKTEELMGTGLVVSVKHKKKDDGGVRAVTFINKRVALAVDDTPF